MLIESRGIAVLLCRLVLKNSLIARVGLVGTVSLAWKAEFEFIRLHKGSDVAVSQSSGVPVEHVCELIDCPESPTAQIKNRNFH